MRAMTLPALLAATFLLNAAWPADAQTGPALLMQEGPQARPAGAAMPEPLPWSNLSADQQRMLAPVHDQWGQLRPGRQHQLAQNAMRWANLPPQRQQQIRQRLARWAAMTPEQRSQARANARAFQNLTPEERAKVNAAFRRFQSLPPAERRALLQRWRALTPQQRKRWAAEHPERPKQR